MPKWTKGQSGNPRGRPSGARDFRSLLASGDEQRIAETIVKRALAGDAVALRIAADRLWPALSRQEVGGHDGHAIQLATAPPDLSDLTNEELHQLEAIALARERRAAETAGGSVSSHRPS